MSMMRYNCLILDHDDTVVDSTASIHHPCFQIFLQEVRPNRTIGLEEYFTDQFEIGFDRMCREKYAFTAAELEAEFQMWQRYVACHFPRTYTGLPELLTRYRAEGGLICVVSHSTSTSILRDYRENGLPLPDAVFGWDLPPEQRKPHPYPLEQILSCFSLSPRQALVVDDMKPGYDMARSCGVDFAAAGWGNPVEEIARFMRRYCNYYLSTVQDLANLLFS